MNLLVAGTIAIDSVVTPRGGADETLGGSATFFSQAASYFGPVGIVSVVGEDFPDEYLRLLQEQPNIDASGICQQPGKTFRWKGKYSQDMNSRETLDVQLNVFGDFDPEIPEQYRDSQYVFLANGSPGIQRKVRSQVRQPRLVFADTMDLWINNEKEELLKLLGEIDGLVLNDQEALLLTGEDFLVNAATKILSLGPTIVIVKKGEHGAMLVTAEGVCPLPAYPTSNLVDPTGAGDSFAGALMGYLASAGAHDHATLKRAMAYGAVTASVNCEGFSLDRMRQTDRAGIDQRFEHYRQMLRID